MSRVLVTGATGLIGRQLLPQLTLAGHDVHALFHDREPPPRLQCEAQWHSADLLDLAATRTVLRRVKPTGLFHLAWPIPLGGLESGLHRAFVTASQSLLREFYAIDGQRALVAGTCFEYDWSRGLCSESDTPLAPLTLYGSCKNELREFLEDFCTAGRLSWAWGRIFFVYGPHQDLQRFVPSVIRGLLEQTPVLCTDGRQVRDYLHAHDVAAGLLRLFESGLRGPCNIGSGEPVTLRQIGDEIAGQLGGRELIRFGAKPTPAGEPPVLVADVTRLREQVGWRPRFTLATGIADTIASFRPRQPQHLSR